MVYIDSTAKISAFLLFSLLDPMIVFKGKEDNPHQGLTYNILHHLWINILTDVTVISYYFTNYTVIESRPFLSFALFAVLFCLLPCAK